MASNSDPRFQYQSLQPASITSAQLDQMMAFVMDSPKGYIGAIVSAIKIAVVTAYIIAREKLVASEQQYAKQQYEQNQASGNQDEVDKDNLGASKK